MIHAKTTTIDGRWSTIGTANIDRLSLTGNYEVNVEIFDDGIAAAHGRIFANDSTDRARAHAGGVDEPPLARTVQRGRAGAVASPSLTGRRT